jgi:hypothetical protein
MAHIQVFDPALWCSTGVCGTDVDQAVDGEVAMAGARHEQHKPHGHDHREERRLKPPAQRRVARGSRCARERLAEITRCAFDDLRRRNPERGVCLFDTLRRLEAHHDLQPPRAPVCQSALLASNERLGGEGQHHVRHPADVRTEEPGRHDADDDERHALHGELAPDDVAGAREALPQFGRPSPQRPDGVSAVAYACRGDIPISGWCGSPVGAGTASLLEAGIRLFEYRPAMMHAKTLMVDRTWAVVGTTNLDNRSFGHNDEVNVTFRDVPDRGAPPSGFRGRSGGERRNDVDRLEHSAYRRRAPGTSVLDSGTATVPRSELFPTPGGTTPHPMPSHLSASTSPRTGERTDTAQRLLLDGDVRKGSLAMAVMRNLPKEAWKPYFNAVSDALIGKWAEVEVASLDLGDQVVAEWLPLLGVTYDSQDDLLDVALGGASHFSHLIRHPRQIEITEGAEGIRNIAVTNGDGTVQVLRLKEPLRLPQSARP